MTVPPPTPAVVATAEIKHTKSIEKNDFGFKGRKGYEDMSNILHHSNGLQDIQKSLNNYKKMKFVLCID